MISERALMFLPSQEDSGNNNSNNNNNNFQNNHLAGENPTPEDHSAVPTPELTPTSKKKSAMKSRNKKKSLEDANKWDMRDMTDRAKRMERYEKWGVPFEVLPVIWDTLIVVGVIYYWVVATFTISRDGMTLELTSGKICLESLFSLLFAFDGYVQLIPHRRHDNKRIKLSLYSLLHFIPALPLDLIFLAAYSDLYVYFAFVRCLKAYRLRNALEYRLNDLSIVMPIDITIAYQVIPLAKFSYYSIVFLHTMTMVRMYLIMNRPSPGPWDVDYPTSLYFVTYTMCTVGYGDIPIITQSEKIFALFLFLCAACVCAVVFGSMAHFLQQGNQASERLGILRSTLAVLEFIEVPPGVLTSVLSFQNYLVHNTLVGNQAREIQNLPQVIQDRLNVFMAFRLIRRSPGIQDCTSCFCMALCASMDSVVFCPADIVIADGEPPQGVHFVSYGVLEVYNPDGQLLDTMRCGDCFGLEELIRKRQHSTNIVALTFIDAYRIGLSDFRELLFQFPQDRILLRAHCSHKSDAQQRRSVARALRSSLSVIGITNEDGGERINGDNVDDDDDDGSTTDGSLLESDGEDETNNFVNMFSPPGDGAAAQERTRVSFDEVSEEMSEKENNSNGNNNNSNIRSPDVLGNNAVSPFIPPFPLSVDIGGSNHDNLNISSMSAGSGDGVEKPNPTIPRKSSGITRRRSSGSLQRLPVASVEAVPNASFGSVGNAAAAFMPNAFNPGHRESSGTFRPLPPMLDGGGAGSPINRSVGTVRNKALTAASPDLSGGLVHMSSAGLYKQPSVGSTGTGGLNSTTNQQQQQQLQEQRQLINIRREVEDITAIVCAQQQQLQDLVKEKEALLAALHSKEKKQKRESVSSSKSKSGDDE